MCGSVGSKKDFRPAFMPYDSSISVFNKTKIAELNTHRNFENGRNWETEVNVSLILFDVLYFTCLKGLLLCGLFNMLKFDKLNK